MVSDTLQVDVSESKQDARAAARCKYWDKYNRFEYTCPDCGRSNDELRNSFEVHHIDGNPTNNKLANLVGLCRPCHNIREGKKPSINDYRHLLGQSDQGRRSTVPLIESQDEENENFHRCDEQSIPILEVMQKTRRKYATVQMDFITTGGWKEFEATGVKDGVDRVRIQPSEMRVQRPKALLNERGVNAVNDIVEQYRDKQQPTDHTNAPFMNHGVDYTRFQPLLTDVALELGNRLRPIVLDRSNWEPDALDPKYIWKPIY
jgi:hypothetical protein